MKNYVKPKIMVERFQLSQTIASCNAMRINSMDIGCILDDGNAPAEMKDLALLGYFMLEGGCPRQATDGAICYLTSANMAFTS